MTIKYTLKSGHVIEHTDEYLILNGKARHISKCYKLEDAPSKKSFEFVLKKNGKNPADVGMVIEDFGSVASSGNEDIISTILNAAYAWRAAEKQKQDAKANETANARARIIAACPAGFEAATSGGWLDGVASYKAADGAIHSNWDNAYADMGMGIYYIPADKFAESRRTREASATAKASRAAVAEKHIADCHAEAIATDKPVILRNWVTDYCTRNSRDCSFDSATEFIHPDGKRSTTFICCH